MKVNQKRAALLTGFVQGLLDKDDGRELYLQYKEQIETVTPQEAFEVFHSLLQKGATPKELLSVLDKAINAFYKSLSSYSWKQPERDSFIDILMQENAALLKKLNRIKDLLKDKKAFPEKKAALLVMIRELQEFDGHYQKKENILFPIMEKKMQRFDGLAIMWALHEEIRSSLKAVIRLLEGESVDQKEFNIMFGQLLFAIHGLIKKEELILFPAASEVIDENEWQDMQSQSLEYGFPYIENPPTSTRPAEELQAVQLNDYTFETKTGTLNAAQLQMIFDSLPVDLTFVDENNKVRYYSGKERIFPRSPAVIGRDVEKCHPPESVQTVLDITEAFRSGRQNQAVFWIRLKGRLIMIRYFALRDHSGVYQGVLEVTQDVTEIKELEGERRLLHWES